MYTTKSTLKLILSIITVFCVFCSFNLEFSFGASDIDSQVGLNPKTLRTKEEILRYYKGYNTNNKTTISFYGLNLGDPRLCFSKPPKSNAPFDEGMIKKDYLEDSLHVYNTTRYAAGLKPVPLVLHASEKLLAESPDHSVSSLGIYADMSKLMQSTSLISGLNKEIDHNPKIPPGVAFTHGIYQYGYRGSNISNLHYTMSSAPAHKVLYNMHFSFIRDAGGNNANVGHRRWQLNPSQSGTHPGIYFSGENGYYHAYGCNLALESIGSDTSKDLIPTPSIYNIAECYIKDAANRNARFSVSYGKDYDFSNATATVIDTSSGKEFRPKTNNCVEKYDNYGGLSVFVMGNDETFKVKPGDRYEIIIKGVKRKGKNWPIHYFANFFSLKDCANLSGYIPPVKNPSPIANQNRLSSKKIRKTISKSRLILVRKNAEEKSVFLSYKSNTALKLSGYKFFISNNKHSNYKAVGKAVNSGVTIHNPWGKGNQIYVKVMGYRTLKNKKTAYTKPLIINFNK